MAEDIKRFVYDLEQVKKVFGEKVEGRSDICLFPLMHAIVDLLREDISKKSRRIGITHVRRMPNQNSIYSMFEMVIGGKIVDFEINSVDIDEEDDDEMIWSICSIAFFGPEAQAKKIFSIVKRMVAKYDFDKLKAAAAERLKKEEKIYHLGDSTRRFYNV